MSVIDAATGEIRALVLSGALLPGEPMGELGLAARLRISRPTVREALRRLEGVGLVDSDGRGLRVAMLDEVGVRSALATRSSLEALHAGMVAARVRAGKTAPAQLRYLGELARATVRSSAGRGRRAVNDDRAFHQAIDALAANPVGSAFLDGVWDRLIVAGDRPVQAMTPERVRAEHGAIVDAIAAGKPRRAREAATRHVTGALA